MSAAESGRLKVLLVDDDPLIRRGYGDRLADAGWEVTIACDGFEAVQAARDDTFDVLLLDLRMPYRDGAEVLRTLRCDPSFAATRVFLLAQPGDADLVEQAAREGVEAVFEKARLGPRDIVAEVQARLESDVERPHPATAADPPPTQNVPSAVDEIARRFRRGHRAFSGDGPPPVTAEIPADVGRRPVSAPAPAHVPAAAEPPAKDAGAEREPDTGPTIAMSPMSIDAVLQSPVQRRQRARDGQAHAAPEAAAPPVAPAHAAAAIERTITGEITGIPGSGSATGAVPPAGGDGTFNVVLNRYVGEAAGLANAMGLPADLMCPVCQRQMALRLAPDPQYENAVFGFFYCPRCTGSAV